MDGITLLREIRGLLQEPDTSVFLDDKTSYTWLYHAACEYAWRTRALTSTASITLTASTRTYSLPADYYRMHLQRPNEDTYFVKISDGTYDHFRFERDYGSIIFQNNTTTVAIPDGFAVTDATPISQISGVASSSGAVDTPFEGECYLNYSTGGFSSNVAAGDLVHNVTGNASGVVVSVVSDTQLVCAIFDNDEGTAEGFASGNTFVINPQGRYSIVFDPIPSTSGYTVSVPYVRRPAPVFSPYRAYPFTMDSRLALVSYALWAYKYRDQEPNFGDALFRHFDMACRKGAAIHRVAQGKRTFRVNLSKRGTPSGSWR